MHFVARVKGGTVFQLYFVVLYIFHGMWAVLALDGEDYKKHSAVIARFTLNLEKQYAEE